MENLPPYEEQSSHSAEVASSSSQNTINGSARPIGQGSPPLANNRTLEVAAEGLVGGSGDFHDPSIVWPICSNWYCILWRGEKNEIDTTETFCPPEHIYQSAASQLDVLLPALSNGALPSTTALRTITLRLDLPTPDAVWISESLRTGPVKGRDTLCRAYKSWLVAFQAKKLELGLLEMAESITGRLALEGFLVLEEWWDPRRGLLMLTVRC
ncbi:hypothetical protein B0J17DRAFT_627986 [Rhizoctonia solani]|nr:hypothetical protein B0J17DRAFT_627986 [Rhizoctonia solani]